MGGVNRIIHTSEIITQICFLILSSDPHSLGVYKSSHTVPAGVEPALPGSKPGELPLFYETILLELYPNNKTK